ncbi:60S ribosomal protein L31 [Candidatus Woesearchaeota archaeon]|nr:60S ribosomal protein L31 [Candidatus Woesearchaeota archaeon]
MNAPSYKRAKKAMAAVRSFLQKHMKSEQVKLGSHLNMHVWKRGIKHPPHHVKVTAIKDDEGVVRAELFGHKPEEKKEEPKGKLEELKEKITGAAKEGIKGKVKKEEKTTGSEEPKKSRSPKSKSASQKEEKNESQRPAVDKQD